MERKLSKIKVSQSNQKFWTIFNKLGFNTEKSIYASDSEFIELLDYLSTLKLSSPETIFIEKMDLDKVKSKTKILGQKLFKGIDTNVNINFDELDKNKNKELLVLYNNLQLLYSKGKITKEILYEKLQNFYINHKSKRTIYDIPITKCDGEHSMNGLLMKGPIIFPSENTQQFLKKTGILFENIYLGGNTNVLSIGTYIHELTHSLIDRHAGVVENYYNDEFLPIFMEKIAMDQIDHSKDKKTVKISEIYRLNDIQKQYKILFDKSSLEEDKVAAIKYIQSGILAGLLFDKYEKANEVNKKNIMYQVRRILDGKKKVKDLIDNENLSLYDAKPYFDKIAKYEKEINPTQEFSESLDI